MNFFLMRMLCMRTLKMCVPFISWSNHWILTVHCSGVFFVLFSLFFSFYLSQNCSAFYLLLTCLIHWYFINTIFIIFALKIFRVCLRLDFIYIVNVFAFGQISFNRFRVVFVQFHKVWFFFVFFFLHVSRVNIQYTQILRITKKNLSYRWSNKFPYILLHNKYIFVVHRIQATNDDEFYHFRAKIHDKQPNDILDEFHCVWDRKLQLWVVRHGKSKYSSLLNVQKVMNTVLGYKNS